MDTATKTGIDVAKTASKWVVQKTAEVTVELIGNKIADKITSLVETKSKEKEKEDERQKIYIPPKKRQDIIDDLMIFLTPYNNGVPEHHKRIRQNAWWST